MNINEIVLVKIHRVEQAKQEVERQKLTLKKQHQLLTLQRDKYAQLKDVQVQIRQRPFAKQEVLDRYAMTRWRDQVAKIQLMCESVSRQIEQHTMQLQECQDKLELARSHYQKMFINMEKCQDIAKHHQHQVVQYRDNMEEEQGEELAHYRSWERLV